MVCSRVSPLPDFHCAWGAQAVPAPIQFGISPRATRDNEIPNLKRSVPMSQYATAPRVVGESLLGFAVNT